MPDRQTAGYKTEEQLKAEAAVRRKAEAELVKAHPKTDLQKKRENFWYHYKWHTVAGIFAVILIIFFVNDMVFRDDPDATIVMVSGEYVSEEIIDELAAEIGDIAGEDGKQAYILIDRITLNEADYASMMKLTAVMASAVDPIYLLDEAAYKHIVSMGDEVFAPESVPADRFSPELEGMRFYLRLYTGKNADYYAFCEDLLNKMDRS